MCTLGPPRQHLVEFIIAQNGCNRCSIFDNMKVLIITFGFKMPIHAAKWIFGDLTP